MKLLSAGLALGVTGSVSLLVACGTEEPSVAIPATPEANGGTFTYQENTQWATADVARDVVVEEGRLLLPASYESWARGVPIGTVLAGDRAPGGAKNNPMGFLRHVQAVNVQYGRVEITTTGASLEDLFSEAHLTMGGEPTYAAPLNDPNIEPKGQTGPQNAGGLQLQGEVSAGMSFEETYAYSTPKLEASAGAEAANVRWEGSMKRRFDVRAIIGAEYNGRGWFAVPNIDMKLQLPWTQTDTACSLVEGEYSQTLLEGKLEGLAIPVFSQSLPTPPMGPVPTSIRAEIKLSCGPFVSGKSQMKNTTTTTGQVQIEFGTDQNGEFYGRADKTQSEPTDSTAYTVQGTGGVKCKITARVGFYFFEWIGAFAEYGLGAEMSVTGQGKFETGKSAEGVVCFDLKRTDQVDVGLTASKWGLSLERSANIWEQVTPLIHACTAEGCANREDGWYCDVSSPAGGFQCVNKAKANGSACQTGQYCQMSDPVSRKAKMASEQPECGTTAPTASSFDSLTCQ